jgi:hypothetical protein
MVMLSKNARLRFLLNGQTANAPKDWQELEVLATFDNEATQANITTSEFTFVNQENVTIRDYVTAGLTGGSGIFEGLPFDIETYNSSNIRSIFKGYLDLTDGYSESQDRPEVSAKLKRDNGLNSFDERLSALSYSFLESKGVFTASDYTTLNYVVVKKVNVFEELMAAVVLFLMIKELREAIRGTADTIANVAAHIGGGATGGIVGAIYAIVIAALQIAYTTVLTIAIIDLGKQLINTLSPFIREHKVLKLDTAIRKVVDYLGYNLVTNIDEMETVYYLPSNPQLPPENFVDEIENSITVDSGTPTGIPNNQDYGYFCTQMFELVLSLFNAKISIIGNDLHLLTKDDPFWIQNATYTLPRARPTNQKYNTEEFQANRFLAFQTDLKDSWTVDNFEGTNYQVITDAVSSPSNGRAKYLKGLDENQFQVCLGSRYDELNRLEEILYDLASRIDSLINIFGNSTNLSDSFEQKTGALKQEKNWTSKPKLIKIEGDKLPASYRQSFSAKVLYDKYHAEKSFVTNGVNPWHGQKIMFEGVRVPFGMEDFLALIDNSYFKDPDNRDGKVVSIKWKPAKDYALVDYWIRTPYTKNLEETFIEPN